MENETMTADMIYRYFPELVEGPFTDQDELIRAWSSFVDLLIALTFERKQNRPEKDLQRISSFRNEQAAEALYAPLEADSSDDEADEDLFNLFVGLLTKAFDWDGLPLYPIAKLTLVLPYYEKWLVILSWMSSRNAKYEKLFSQLQEGDRHKGKLTVGIAYDLARFFLPKEEWNNGTLGTPDEEEMSPFPQSSYFVRYLFAEDKDEDYWSVTRTLELEPTAIAFFSGEKGKDSGFTGGMSDELVQLCDEAKKAYVAQEGTKEELYAALLEGIVSTDGLVVDLCGEAGSGKQFLLIQAAGELGRRVLHTDAGQLLVLSEDKRVALCRDIILKCTLYGWILYVSNIPESVAEYEQELDDLFGRLCDGINVICVGTPKGMPKFLTGVLRGHRKKVNVPYASEEIQLRLWEIFAREMFLEFPEGYQLSSLVSKYTMNPGRIAEALINTKMLADEDDEVIDIGRLEEQIRALSAADFGDNATQLSSPFTWDDLVVPDMSRHLLELACDRVRYSMTVNGTYGFGKKLPYGRGVAIVLYGPPGTGKTMAAQVIAKELGLDIFRVDLSQVSSKYIGETEKNLGAIFDAAKNSNAILFFDEADSLFSKRTEVSSSNDKYANAETSYLLQKIEEYAGVSVLATNNMQNFDAAFKRRMTFLIPLEQPDEKTRVSLWEKAYPPEAPLSPMVDARVLAGALELTGAQIKAIATESAYIAAAKGVAIDYEAIIEAVDMECAKTGTLRAGETLRSAIMEAMY